jgi:hypothetical protein
MTAFDCGLPNLDARDAWVDPVAERRLQRELLASGRDAHRRQSRRHTLLGVHAEEEVAAARVRKRRDIGEVLLLVVVLPTRQVAPVLDRFDAR